MNEKWELVEGFNWERKDEEIKCDYLYNINRLGCDIKSEEFTIVRDYTYSYYTIHYIYKGEGILQVNDKLHKIKVGDLFILGPYEQHCYINTGKEKINMAWIEFEGLGARDLINVLFSKENYLIDIANIPNIQKKIFELIASKKYAKWEDYIISEKLYSLLLNIIKEAERLYRKGNEIGSKENYPIKIALDYIESNLYKNIKVKDLALQVGYSTSNFNKLFNKHIGTTPYRYVTLKKIEWAVCKLEAKEMNSREIAEHLGYVDHAHFIRVFKKVTGYTPQNYINARRYHIESS